MEGKGPKGGSRLVWKAVRMGGVLLISLSVAVILVKTKPRPEKREVHKEAPLAQVLRVRGGPRTVTVTAYGTVRSAVEVDLTAEVGGKVVETAPGFDEGVFFPKGARLLRIDPRDYELSVERFKAEGRRLEAERQRLKQEEENIGASLRLAREEAALAREEWERNRALQGRKVISQTQLDKAHTAYLASAQRVQELENALRLIRPGLSQIEAQKAVVQSQLQGARLALERTVVRVPFDCRILEKRVERGEFVSPGRVVARIYAVDRMEVEVRIPPDEAVWLQGAEGDGLYSLKGVRARVVFEGGSRPLAWEAKVARFKGVMESRTRTLPLVIEVTEAGGSDQELFPGMFVKVEIQGRRLPQVFVLPREALREEGAVYVVQQGRLVPRSVTVVRWVRQEAYVTEGLRDGETVLVRMAGIPAVGMQVRERVISGSGGPES